MQLRKLTPCVTVADRWFYDPLSFRGPSLIVIVLKKSICDFSISYIVIINICRQKNLMKVNSNVLF